MSQPGPNAPTPPVQHSLITGHSLPPQPNPAWQPPPALPQLYYLDNSRYEHQRQEMQELEAQGRCIFCPGQARPDDEALVVHRSQHWTLRRNAYPYKGAKVSLLLVPDQHVDDPLALSADVLADFWQLLRWARTTYQLPAYGLAARCGSCAYTAGSITHAHVHLLGGDVQADPFVPIRVKLSSRPGASAG